MADGSVVIEVGLDDSDLKKGIKNVKSEVATLAAEYRKTGLSASDAFKKAWNEVDHGSATAQKVGADLSDHIGGGAQRAVVQVNGLATTLKKIGGIIGSVFAIQKLAEFGESCIELGSDVAEVQNVVDVAFGDMAYMAEDFASRAITQFGMSTLAAKRTSSIYMAMAKGMGVADSVASDMSITLAGLSGDVASFFNISQELADIKLRSVFTGETETLKDLGVVMTQDNLKAYALAQGITTSYTAMTQAEQVALRYNFVLDSLALSVGDFARTQDSWANQTRILSMQWQEFMAIIGQALTTILLPLVRVLNQIVSWLITAANAFNSVISSIFGGATKEIQQTGTTTTAVSDAIGGAVDNQNALTDAVKKTNKEQAKSLAGFDEINKLADDTAQSTFSDGVHGGGFSPSDFASGVRGGTFSVEVSGVDDVDWRERFSGLIWVYDNVLVPLGQWVGNELLPRFFELLSASLEFFGAVIDKLKPAFMWFWDNLLVPLASFAGDSILVFLDTLTKRLQQLTDVLNGDMSLTEFIADLSALEKILVAIGVAILGLKAIDSTIHVFKSTSDFFKNLTGLNPIELLKKISAKMLGFGKETENAGKSIDKTSKSTGTLTEKIKNGLATFGLIGGITLAVEAFLSMWEDGFNMVDETLMLIGLAIAAVAATVLGVPATVSAVIAAIIAVITTLLLWIKTNNVELWNDITAWFKQHVAPKFTLSYWKEKFGSIKDAMVSVLDGIKRTVSNAVSWITDKLNIKAKITADTSGLNKSSGARSVNTRTMVQQSTPTLYKLANIPPINLPMLAQGAVIPPNHQFLAVLGDQKQGTNIETPLTTMKQAFVEAMQESDIGGGTYKFEIYLNGHKMAVEMVKEVNNMTRAAGKPVILF